MNWFVATFSSTIGRKVMMSITGLFLIIFLVGHVSGNFLLFKNDGGQAFNEYALFMTTNPIVKILSIITYVAILGHVAVSIILQIHNRKARPVNYAVANPSANSPWNSRNMGILGTFILIFIVIHMQNFWYQMQFGEMPMVNYGDGVEYKNLYLIVAEAFSVWWYVAIYVFSMIMLGIHLSHGFQSAFQTLGINHKKYTPFIKKLGLAFSILVPAAFASIPIYMFFL
ncbi:MAG: succinate dehydrogenase cytochrome b subunit [Cyclobacteriaceae bacterium]|nr:succinate dehydrogenase cytochrome b subunit [Cyclobacteriaceae bacterium]MCH8516940.1 succinate dehydrogenase cytochrome b subunit [Cyclobacteriaceae bacterium]